MNIFVLDKNPTIAAMEHCDKHVVKMIVETAQLLCGVHWVIGSKAHYRLTHKNHPCSIWVRECIENYDWLCLLGVNLCYEYTYRYGKVHKTKEIIDWCMINRPNLPSLGSTTEFKLCMPDNYKSECVVSSYRAYYIGEKSKFAVWSKRKKPKWFSNKLTVN